MSDISAFSLERPYSGSHYRSSRPLSPHAAHPSSSFLRTDAMSSPTSPSRPSPNDLQSHLYASFLQRKTADVALRISGSWNAIYRLHRVILIQAGFFQSLFTSGFSESQSKLSSHRVGPEYIDIVFDDPNITRAAFEVCIARLYGGGPPLWISSSLIPTATFPLTPSFSSAGHPSSQSNLFPHHVDISHAPALPSGHHAATPRFLLSLLATAVFLSIPSVASQALTAVLRTVGPHSVSRYLNFATGRGIGPVYDPGSGNEGVDHESEAAVGLEEVAELVKDVDPTSSYESIELPSNLEQSPSRDRSKSMHKNRPGSVKSALSKHSYRTSVPPDSDSDSETDNEAQNGAGKQRASSDKTGSNSPEPCYYYGAVSDKVGEAAACWLSRWGVDMLRYEQQLVGADGGRDVKDKDVIWSPTPHHIQWEHDRPGSAPPEMAGPRVGGKSMGVSGKSIVVPLIWRRGGLTARWVRGILSSDALFVRGEKERYEISRSVVEMRRAAREKGVAGESEEIEEAEYERLFHEGIYYANMHMDDLMSISQDISPTTGKPMVPLAVLQAALWNQSKLHHRITFRAPGSASPSLSPADSTKELGLGVLPEQISTHPEERDVAYYPIPTDSSFRLGDSTGLEGASMDQLFEGTKGNNANEENFFGLERSRRLASSFSSPTSPSSTTSASDREAKWTVHPPFRFAVEFWDIDALKEKSRLHSHTVWYAGSLYNVYVQVVRKKGVQLGIYLHRQSTVDPIPPSSAPISGILPPPPRDRATGRGASSSVSTPRPPSVGSTATVTTPSTSLSPLARALTASSTPSSPTSPMSSSLHGASAFSRSSSTLHASSGSVGSVVPHTVSLPATAPPVTPAQPYRDPRPKVSAYFTIACASATGASLTRFTSAPDDFVVSQSWGWKSSSLRTEEYLEVDAEGQPIADVVPAGREVSLRATVVLGVV